MHKIKLSDWEIFMRLWMQKAWPHFRYGQAMVNFFKLKGEEFSDVFYEKNDKKAMEKLMEKVEFIAG